MVLAVSFLLLAAVASCASVQTLEVERVEKRQQPGAVSADVFLRRAFHASTIVGKYLYIDGGQFSFMNNGTPSYQYANAILSLDMSKDWQNKSVVLTPTQKPSWAEPANGGALWYHENSSLIYTGMVGSSSDFDVDKPSPKLAINTFKPDGSGSGQWNQLYKPGDPIFKGLNKPSYSSTTSGVNACLMLDGGNSSTWFPGLVTFSMDTKNVSNATAAEAGPVFWRGQMHFVPIYSYRGIMISLGGTTGGADGLKSFSTLSIYNPFQRTWINQTTTGNAPAGRVDHCVAGARSSSGTWEIFVYGGYNSNLGASSVAFDTIHILTLPAFHWIQVPYNPANPRHGMTCHSVGGSQILVVGGADSNPKKTTGNLEQIQYSKLESPDPNKQGLAVFDMTELTWKNGYSASPPPYDWSEPIKQYYQQAGGVPATISKLNPALQDTVKNPSFDRVPPGLSVLSANHPSNGKKSSPSKKPKPKVGVIAGGVVGGIAALAALAALIYIFMIRRRRRRDQDKSSLNSLSDQHAFLPAEGGDKPLPYMYGDGSQKPKLGMGDQSIEPPVEADAVEQERDNIFEAEGRPIIGQRRRTDKQTPSELPT